MGDSEDEYDRKRRDKFRGERSSGDNYRADRRSGEERGRGREDWNERGRNRPDYREYRGRERFSPERGPPMKRMRDWGHDNFGGYNGGGGGAPGWGVHEHYSLHNVHGFPGGVGHIQSGIHNRIGQETQNNSDVQTQPPMLTLKQFLASQDDSISDSDAIAKYNEYKLDFKKQQLNEFFVTHKDEEWFKSKYHPVDSKIKNDGQMQFLNKRKETFLLLLEQGEITNVTVDTTQSEPLLKLLDTTVIYLEGGNQDDIKMLSEKVKPIEFINKSPAPVNMEVDDTRSISALKHEDDVCLHPTPIVTDKSWDDDDEDQTNNNNTALKQPSQSVNDEENTNNPVVVNDTDESKDNSENKSEGDLSGNIDTFGKQKQIRKKNKTNRIKTNSESSNSTSSSTSDVETDRVTEANGDEEENKNNDNEANTNNDEINVEKNDKEDKEGNKALDDKDKDVVTKESETIINNDTVESMEKVDDKSLTIDLDQDECSVVIDKNTPRELHRTSSIFLRNLAPTITKAEIETLCKRYNGYLRVAIADPLVERRWFRRGWVTFKRDTNIKEICWNLNNIRLRDCELGAIVNRDLSRRVRPINGITTHKTIVRNDIKLCAKIAHNLDTVSGIWSNNSAGTANENNQANEECQSFGLHSRNPVLQNITDYLIEEASAEEDELLGLSGNDNKDTDGEFLERDVELISVLDKLILYLRIVHSVDFYNHCEYPYEDEMPNRCGIIHARGPPPQNKIQSNEIQDYIRIFEGKLTTFLIRNETLDDAEMKKIGAKDVNVEIEKFVQVNTQELAKDKWLCPLSGKKFKGPEFIKKHIFNKHGEKVDEVKKEVEYFNAYLKDPKRPTLPEHPGNNRKVPNEMVTPQQPGYRPYQGPGYMGPPYAGYAPQIMMPSRPRGGGGGGGGGRRGNGGEYRPIIHYRDLDAPREPEDFL